MGLWFIISEKRLHNFCFQRKCHQAPCVERLIKVDLDTFSGIPEES